MLRLTKYSHSCLFIESDQRNILIDPGVYSWESPEFNISIIDRVDRIGITHSHSDHMHLPFVKALAERFPRAHIVANNEIKKELEQEEIKLLVRDTTACTVAFDAPHEELAWSDQVPKNTGFNVLGFLTHPGDSLSLRESKAILALPMTAPWGSTTDAINLAIKLKPQAVIPIHDWHWKDEARQSFYAKAKETLARHNIDFIALESGEGQRLN